MREHDHGGYGAFPGGDPRLFTPDPECSDAEEVEAHRAACAEWDRAQKEGRVPAAVPAAHYFVHLPGGYAHVARRGFGLGIYSIPCTDPKCPDGQEPEEPDPPGPSLGEQVNDDRWDAAVREAFAGDDEDLGDQAEELGEVVP
jgi:hypothetical protein